MDHAPDTLARLEASPPRRIFAAAVLGGLAALLAWLAAAGGGTLAGVLALLALAAGCAFAAVSLWRATGCAIVLTGDALREEGGRVLAPISSIAAVDRGMFAAKPSGGFILRLDHGAGFAWAPGMWWRMGRRVGVGGVTAGAQARSMADILALRLARGDHKAGS
ncbi:hypothetical protein E2L08_01745 [Palleronia sediminis]|uniref:PH domain-containing protein n=1 Tax=Palleronia sediminis TaxID=2547833 RepID=A0A4R6ALS2_9RHOB|nr:hypothetical protein [Palleronia sediminis]TDL84214.1 hypothetical protein E2L08_01745 [Palleronia sediminis]